MCNLFDNKKKLKTVKFLKKVKYEPAIVSFSVEKLKSKRSKVSPKKKKKLKMRKELKKWGSKYQ